MIVGVAYAKAAQQVWTNVEVPEGATIRDAIAASGILNKFPEIDLETQKVGIFGKLSDIDSAVDDGDRVEIYRPITADPETVERRDQ
jgi:putative ubiquitin-RnfH superfamily antitoxin RatB of RatAB toxin-antitoxin module